MIICTVGSGVYFATSACDLATLFLFEATRNRSTVVLSASKECARPPSPFASDKVNAILSTETAQSESASINGITSPTNTVHQGIPPLPSLRDEATPVKVDADAEAVFESVIDVPSDVVVVEALVMVEVDTPAVVVETGLTPGVMVIVVRIELTTASSGRTSVARPLGRVDP